MNTNKALLVAFVLAVVAALTFQSPVDAQGPPQPEPTPVVSPLEQITVAVGALTSAIDRHATDQAAVTSAGDTVTRAREALTAAETRETTVGETATATSADVIAALDATVKALESIRDTYE